MNKAELIRKAVREESRNVRRSFTPTEMEELKKTYIESAIIRNATEAELAGIKKDFKDRLDELNGYMDNVIMKIKLKYEMRSENCYAIPNFESGFMEFFTIDGQLVDKCQLTPEDRQLELDRQAEIDSDVAHEPAPAVNEEA